MKRIFDIVAAIAFSIFLVIPMLFIALLIKLTSKGPVLYWSDRVGVNNKTFRMPKFRTMQVDTPVVAKHLLVNPDRYLTPIGPFLRRFGFDEFPQLWSVLKGDMSFVGPRPALYNQYDLIEFRTKKGIHMLVPGVTGWAQIQKNSGPAIPVKVEYDDYYLRHRSFLFDMKIIFLTFSKVIKGEGVTH